MAFAQPAQPSAPQATLHILVENAWQRSPQVRTLEARQDEAAAGLALADSWLASAPTLGILQRTDQWTDRHERRESEISLSAPIWTPGQKARRTDLANASANELASQLAQAKLEISGQVRTRLWQARAAKEIEIERADHWSHLQELANDVERRVKAGDLARSDVLLASQEVSLAHSNFIAARTDAKAALARFSVLTGMTTLPDVEIEPVAPSGEPIPLRLQAARAAELRARAAIAAVRAQPASAPTVAVSMRRERDGVGMPNDRSIGIALQIPLIGQQRNRPAEAAATTQLASASADLAQLEAQAQADIALARDRLADAEEALRLAEQRAGAMQEHTRLFDKAFAAGERALPELLRSRILSHEAQIALRQQRVALGMARAELNQALGIIP
ncbi:hypothetical protein ASE26_05065 [Duganella sp. Root198D2]|nr:hypothetical protein ASD07_01505 [Duganella sp. Root336D2]KRB92356.1 hypothetical protein ASE26_05065 [Duganella sp. Root198D2]